MPSERRMTDLLTSWGVLTEYARWRIGAFGIGPHLDWRDGGFMLTGRQGSGKSCLAAAILADISDPTHPETLARAEDTYGAAGAEWKWPERAVAWRYAPELVRQVMDSWRRQGEGSAMREIMRPHIIVIDDLGAEKSNEHTIPIMREIVERCVNGKKRLVVTSNLSLSDLSAIDPRLASRLSMLQPIRMPDVDLRLQAYRAKTPMVARMPGKGVGHE